MVWDPEKYRQKRERVLGIRKKGVSFSVVAVLVSAAILAGFAAVTLPGPVSYLQTRHLDDAIFRLTTGHAWPEPVLSEILKTPGVKQAAPDHHGGRLVITFDRRHTGPDAFAQLFQAQALSVVLLNQLSHRHHQHVMAQEKEAEGEAL